MTDDSSPIPSDGASEPTGEADNLFAVALPKNDDAFPVLRAFQTFIDQERERSRRRITMLSTAFIVALVVLMLAFVGFFALFYTQVMSHDEAQLARLFELVSRGPAPQPAPAAAPAPAPAPQPSATPENLADLVEKLVAERLRASAPAPAPAPEPEPAKAASAAPAASPASPPLPRGILSPVKRSTPRPSTPSSPTPAPTPAVPSAPSAPVAPAPASTPAPTPAVPSVPSVPSVPVAPSPSPSLRTISVRPVKALVVPEGYEADQIRVQTQSGASIPLRTLLPVPRAGR